MDAQQLQTLKAAILADPVLSAYPMNSDGSYAIAELLNKPAVPAFIVWKTDVSIDEIMRNGMDWARVDNLSVGKARVWEWLFDNGGKAINHSKANVRAGIDQTWVGTAADLAVRAAVYTHCKRPASRVERLFATGAGTDGSPGLMAFEGEITTSDVSAMLSGER